jgi:hypothetical protein
MLEGVPVFVTSVLENVFTSLDVCECVRDVRYENKGHHISDVDV